MGLAASSARLFYLIARKMDIQFESMVINQARMRITNIMDRYISAFQSLDPNQDVIRRQELLFQALSQQDKRFELALNRLKIQLDSITTEMETVRKFVNDGVQGFKAMA
ncbi:MAG: hypothetical protein ACKO37_10320 [Vampirovibrionales bacterium]|jgi:hypothetical protein